MPGVDSMQPMKPFGNGNLSELLKWGPEVAELPLVFTKTLFGNHSVSADACKTSRQYPVHGTPNPSRTWRRRLEMRFSVFCKNRFEHWKPCKCPGPSLHQPDWPKRDKALVNLLFWYFMSFAFFHKHLRHLSHEVLCLAMFIVKGTYWNIHILWPQSYLGVISSLLKKTCSIQYNVPIHVQTSTFVGRLCKGVQLLHQASWLFPGLFLEGCPPLTLLKDLIVQNNQTKCACLKIGNPEKGLISIFHSFSSFRSPPFLVPFYGKHTKPVWKRRTSESRLPLGKSCVYWDLYQAA